MKIRCEHCRSDFDFPLAVAGKVEYARCKNVFRVSYRFRTPCPHCRTILQLTPVGRDGVIGLPASFDRDEKTEPFLQSAPLEQEGEQTLPRTEPFEEPLPTIRVTQKTPLPKKSVPFRLIQDKARRNTPLHVAVRPSKSLPLPLAKIFLTLIVAFGTSLTVGLTLLALRSSSPPPATPPKPEHPILQGPAFPPLRNSDARGGPIRDNVIVEVADSEEPEAPTLEEEPEPESFHWPRNGRITSTFGQRIDPFSGDVAFHGGIDIAASQRAEVNAALDGKVHYVGRKGGYGNTVILDHGDGYQTLYGHLAKPLIRKGARVRQGDLIGLLGSTGRSTGPHIHFELRRNGRKIDPLRASLMARRTVQRSN